MLNAAAFFMDATMGAIFIAIPLLAIRMRASPFELGLFGFLFSVFYTFLAPVFGRLCEKTGSKKLVLPAALISMAFCALLPFLNSLPMLFVFTCFFGVWQSMFWPCLETWIAKNSGKNLLRAVGYFSVAWCAGISFGNLASGMLSGINLRYPSYMGVVLCGLAVISLWRAREQKPVSSGQPALRSLKSVEGCPVASLKPEKQPGDQKTSQPANDSINKRNAVFLRVAWMSNFMIWFVIGSARFLFPKLAVDTGILPGMLGFMLFSITASQAVVSLVMSHTSKWRYKFSFLIIVEAIVSVGFLILCFPASNPLIFAAFIITGAGAGVAYFSSLYYSLADTSSKGSGSGIHESIVGSGSLLGPLIAGILAQNFTLRAPYMLCVGLIAGVILVQIIYFKVSSRSIKQ